MSWIVICVLCLCAVARTQVIPGKSRTNEGDYNTVNTDGSFDFGYANKDRGSSYHLAHGNANKVVGGRFGAVDPGTGTVKETVYTAGPRGFRAKGPNVHRKMDLDQRPRGPIGNKDDPYYDPSEDPSYGYKIDTRTFTKNENADSRGDVKGHYSYVDDVGERHDVSYVAGRDTGFHVSSAHPDSPAAIGAPFHRAPLVRGELRPRGRTAVQRGLDGSYRFISAGPDQRRTESSDSHGNVRGSYTFLDDKGVQRTVNYIAGPGIGYRIVKSNKDPYIPAYFPTIPSAYDSDFVGAGSTGFSPDDTGSGDVFKGPDGTAASGHVKPKPFHSDKDKPIKPGKKPFNQIDTTGSTDDVDITGGDGYTQSFNQGGNQSPFNQAGGNQGGSGQGSYNQGGSNQGPFNHGNSGQGSYNQGGIGSSNLGGNQGTSSGGDLGYIDEDTSFGTKPTKGPGKPGRPASKPYKPAKKPYVPLKPFQTVSSDDDRDDFHTEKSDKDGPLFGIGFNIQHSKPGTTIIKNIGQDYFGVPPGASVRAHVQSIDLYPYESKPISPAEAIEKDKT